MPGSGCERHELTVFSMSAGFLSWPRILRSLMAAYSSSTRRPGVGMSGTPPASFSLSVLQGMKAGQHCTETMQRANAGDIAPARLVPHIRSAFS